MALPRSVRQRIADSSKEVEIALHEVLCESDQRIRYLCCPVTGYISLLAPVDRHSMLEVGLARIMH